MAKKKTNVERFLFILLCSVVLASLLFLNAFLFEWDLFKLGGSILVNIITPLLIFLVLYFVFIRNGIDLNALVSKINERDENVPAWLINGYTSYSDIEWESFVKSSKNLTVVAFYFDEWINQNRRLIETMLQKKNANLTVILPDPLQLDLISKITQLIPKYDENNMVSKINLSIKEIEDLAKTKRNKDSKIEIYLHQELFNYTFQVFDDKYLFLSLNELSRKENYQSPWILFDITQEREMEEFFIEEIESLKTKENSMYY